MIIEEYIEDNTRVYHYSDQNKKIKQIETGILYYDAIDVLPCRYTYEETDEDIPVIEEVVETVDDGEDDDDTEDIIDIDDDEGF